MKKIPLWMIGVGAGIVGAIGISYYFLSKGEPLNIGTVRIVAITNFLNIHPSADIFIDGTYAGRCPELIRYLPAGSHTVSFGDADPYYNVGTQEYVYFITPPSQTFIINVGERTEVYALYDDNIF